MKGFKIFGIIFILVGVLLSCTIIFIPFGMPMIMMGLFLLFMPSMRRKAHLIYIQTERDLERLRRESI